MNRTTKRAAKGSAKKKGTERDFTEKAKPHHEAPAFDPYAPPLEVLIKLGSLLVHVEELIETVGGIEELKRCILSGKRGGDVAAVPFDLAAIKSLLPDEALQTWRAHMKALLPVKRSER